MKGMKCVQKFRKKKTMPLCFVFWVIFSLPKIHFCCKHRSQHQNKSSAMAVLQSRLDQLEMVRQAQMNAQHTQSLTDITWGSQIRSYVLHVHSGTLLVSIAKFMAQFQCFSCFNKDSLSLAKEAWFRKVSVS